MRVGAICRFGVSLLLRRVFISSEIYMKQIGKVACIVCLAALLSACQSTPEGEEGISSEINTENVYQSALKVYRDWQKKLQEIDHLQVYSPDKYAQIQSSWQKADAIYQEFSKTPEKAFESYSLFSSSTYLDRFYEEVAIVEKTFGELEELKKLADEVLEPAITQMAYLNSIHARDYYRSEHVRLMRFYAKLFRLVEEDELSDATEEQDEFLERAHSLEIRTIKKTYIEPLENALRKLRSNDVKYYAPLSYARVESKIASGKMLIERSPRTFEKIEQQVIETNFELAHAEHIALEVQALRDRSRDEYESFMLDIETKLLNISQALSDKDLRDKPLKEQAALITQEVMANRKHNMVMRRELEQSSKQDGAVEVESLRDLVAVQQKQIAQLKSQLRDLKASPYRLNAELASGSVPLQTPEALPVNPAVEDAPETQQEIQ